MHIKERETQVVPNFDSESYKQNRSRNEICNSLILIRFVQHLVGGMLRIKGFDVAYL